MLLKKFLDNQDYMEEETNQDQGIDEEEEEEPEDERDESNTENRPINKVTFLRKSNE